MHDLRAIRDNPAEFDAGLKRRGLPPRAKEVLALDTVWRLAETELQQAQARSNQLAREIGIAKKSGADAGELLRQSAENKDAESVSARVSAEARKEIDALLVALPNLPAPDVPEGPDETANQLIRTEGTPPQFNFAP